MYTYTIEVILFQLGFLLVFEFFLKNETFFNYNRLYLLATPVLAFLIPFLKLEFLVEAVPRNTGILLPEVFIGNKPIPETGNQAATQLHRGMEINWWYLSYLAGFAVSFILFLKKYHCLNRLFRFRKITEEKDFKIIEVPNSDIACTFLNTVFLGDQLTEKKKNQILSHELVHVKHKHSLDLIFFEIMKILFWFNPLIYIYQSRIASLHEFIADHEVVKTTNKQSYYQQLLNTVFSTQNISFINQFFNHSLIKKRILMLQKNKSSKLSKFKFLLVIPLMLAMLTYVACSENQNNIEETTANGTLQDNTLVVQVGDISNQTEEEKTKVSEALAKMNGSDAYSSVKIIGNEKTIVYHEDPSSGKAQIQINRNNGEVPAPKTDVPKDFKVVPFAVIEQIPTFPECEGMKDREAQKFCVSNTIANLVNENFNVSLGKELGLTGVNRIVVQFRINEQGNIDGAKARASVSDEEARQKLQAEAVRVIKGLPKMNPGMQDGKEVSVMYSLPIAFKIGE